MKLKLDIIECLMKNKKKKKGHRCFKWQFMSSDVGWENSHFIFLKGNLKKKKKTKTLHTTTTILKILHFTSLILSSFQ